MGALSEDRVKDIMEDMNAPPGKTMWDKLANVGEETLANYLKMNIHRLQQSFFQN